MSNNDPPMGRAAARHVSHAWVTPRRSGPVPSKPDDRRAGVYKRYSTLGQKETSIERQHEVCLAYIEQTGRSLASDHADRGRSGASTVGRAGLEAMLRDAKEGLFGILVIEHVDRLARDLGIAANVFKTLQRLGIAIHVPGRGALSLTDLAVQAMMGDEYRKDFIERSQYGIREMAREGRFPSGPCFGYRAVPGKPGVCEKDPVTSEVVKRIFAMRADGVTYRAISGMLHREGVRSHRGGRITSQGVEGMLRNARYIGLLFHNRTQTVKDPDSGSKKVHVRPRDEWIVTEVPEARIVEQEVWDRVRAIQASQVSHAFEPKEERASYLLSGRVACPECGRWMNAGRTHRNKYWKCTEAYVYDTCAHTRTYSVTGLDGLVLETVAEELADPAFAEAYAESYNEERAKAGSGDSGQRSRMEHRVRMLTRKLDRSLDREFGDGCVNPRVVAWRGRAEAELQVAEAELAALRPAAPLAVDRGRTTALREAILGLSLDAPFRPRDDAGLRLAAAVRQLVARVDVRPGARGRFDADVVLRFGSLIGLVDDADVVTRTVTKGCLRTNAGHHVHRAAPAGGRGDWRPLTDAEWDAVRSLLPAASFTRYVHQGADPRPTLDALMCVILTGRGWRPASEAAAGGGHLKTRYRAGCLLRSKEWPSIAGALADVNPPLFGDVPEMSRAFVDWSWLMDKRLRRP
ncbi:DNA invertase Pin-like site-specific DNA recombinase [Methylobacterium brachiatum]|uniref:DNA invertase Pin-like site-specific DNA recombinase n=1 Tax=Methylobacterium brachiatum TaxID=269660 RepID=A0AAJ1TK94_9HYPH|nr:recombinase family protein [Methylobacterium brachiatum]MCB4802168.1 recombinase family protein [Methylobacterium brachiatum]MDQ0542510.1 DNA invertase Pin-like site-specific DNA recombinase [Methylobacterium brachiatum]